jgi:hypothetical protein
MNVLYSDMFDVVKSLNDEEEYEIKLVFDFVIFEHLNENGEIDFELGISGKRY